MLYLARVEDKIYVLDCFEKDTAKTERKDLNTARQRLSSSTTKSFGGAEE